MLAGDPVQYHSIPSGVLGITSRVPRFDFIPLNPSLPCTVEFTNWGHINSVGGVAGGFSSELVLDDVIINAVPTPGAAVVFALGGLLAQRRRRPNTGQ